MMRCSWLDLLIRFLYLFVIFGFNISLSLLFRIATSLSRRILVQTEVEGYKGIVPIGGVLLKVSFPCWRGVILFLKELYKALSLRVISLISPWSIFDSSSLRPWILVLWTPWAFFIRFPSFIVRWVYLSTSFMQ